MRERIKGLDELRGIAISGVMLAHVLQMAGWPYYDLPLGTTGVNLFFIISGFLITTILVTTKGRPGYLTTFYIRRSLRILPLAFVAIGISYAWVPQTRHLVWPYLLFYSNYSVQWTRELMVGLGQMWSLAVEEQFYIVWPLVVLAVPRRRLWMVVSAVILVSWAWGVLERPGAPFERPPGSVAFWGTHLHAYIIGIGAWLALVNLGMVPRPRVCLVALGLWLALVMAIGGQVYWLDLPVMGLITGAVWLAVSGRAHLNVHVLRWLGLRCYGLYLLHVLAMSAVALNLERPYGWTFIAMGLTAACVAAEISYRCLERPIVAWGHRTHESVTPIHPPS